MTQSTRVVRRVVESPSGSLGLITGTCWDLSEAEALVLDRLMRTGEGATALEQGWLLHELTVRFALALEDRWPAEGPARSVDRSGAAAGSYEAVAGVKQ